MSAQYIFMSRLQGITASELYDDVLVNQDNMDRILTQMAHFHLDLFRYPFSRLGGLKIDPKRIGEIVVGPPMNEHYYQASQISKYWRNDETYESLNPSSTNGYATFVEWVADHVRKYIHGICISSTMQKFRQHTPRLQNFVSHIEQTDFREKFNDVPFRLAHNDLHFSQFLVDPATLEITGLLDWEFTSVVPFPLWRRSFLMYLGHDYETSVDEREQLYKRFEGIVACLKGGEAMLKAMRWKHREQELVWEVCDKLRSIVQVCVYGKGEGRENTWMERVLHCLDELSVKED